MSTPALALTDVKKSFGKTEIIRGVNLSIAAGERHAIIGPNGAGKSTLFNFDFGPLSGEFWLDRAQWQRSHQTHAV
jgi:branched-chain amino acid transport system ATP-binding protein